jgi:hypothetical protein
MTNINDLVTQLLGDRKYTEEQRKSAIVIYQLKVMEFQTRFPLRRFHKDALRDLSTREVYNQLKTVYAAREMYEWIKANTKPNDSKN